jgi:hypothetical protein
VQARRLRHIRPGLRVEPIVGSIEDVPIGMLRSDVVLTGLDSRLARQVVAYRCWVLGIPWIDAGIEAEGSLAQATLYVPGEGRGCYLCNWSPRDFEVVEQTYPCELADDRAAEPVATNAPSSLGALAASLLSIECEKLIRDPQMMRAEGFSILIDAENHQYYKTRIAYNDRCSAIWHGITPVSVASECSPAATFEGLFRARNADRGRKAPVDPVDGAGGRLRVFGQTFVTALTCPACATRRDIVCVGVSLKTNPAVTCQRCGHPMVTAGLDTAEELDCSRLPQEALRQPIESVGIRAGDILRVTLGEGEPFDVLVRPNRRRKT